MKKEKTIEVVFLAADGSETVRADYETMRSARDAFNRYCQLSYWLEAVAAGDASVRFDPATVTTVRLEVNGVCVDDRFPEFKLEGAVTATRHEAPTAGTVVGELMITDDGMPVLLRHNRDVIGLCMVCGRTVVRCQALCGGTWRPEVEAEAEAVLVRHLGEAHGIRSQRRLAQVVAL